MKSSQRMRGWDGWGVGTDEGLATDERLATDEGLLTDEGLERMRG